MLRVVARLFASKDKWAAGFLKETKKAAADMPWETAEGINVRPLYTKEDAPDKDEYPGVFPYTRGPYSSMYTNKAWTIRQYAGFGTV
jgi:methylmalonyl-CoA mutase